MTTVKQILVAIDFGESTSRVLEYGRMLADACLASLQLLHVIPPPLEDSGATAHARQEACKKLEAGSTRPIASAARHAAGARRERRHTRSRRMPLRTGSTSW